MSAPSPSQDPLAQLMVEHRAFRDRTRSFSEAVGRYEALVGTVPLDAELVAEFSTFLADDVDRRHGAKEEEGLFPALARHVPSDGGPVGMLLQEHEELRGFQRALAQAAGRLTSDAEDPETQRTVLRSAGEVHQLLDLHIDKEETVLFPMAREILSPGDLASVAEAFLAVDERMGPVTLSQAGGGGSQLPPFCAAGRARRDRAERA